MSITDNSKVNCSANRISLALAALGASSRAVDGLGSISQTFHGHHVVVCAHDMIRASFVTA
jgi:hypothetical protein